jgi:hypothetical protein
MAADGAPRVVVLIASSADMPALAAAVDSGLASAGHLDAISADVVNVEGGVQVHVKVNV